MERDAWYLAAGRDERWYTAAQDDVFFSGSNAAPATDQGRSRCAEPDRQHEYVNAFVQKVITAGHEN